MRKYGMKETKEIKKIICNKCGREITAVQWIAQRRRAVCRKTLGLFFQKGQPGRQI